VWDDTGREYLDFVAGIAVVGLGHCAPAPLAAAHAQLDRLWHASNLYWTEPMLRLAGLLAERFDGGQAFFCNSGAEANEAALKIARKATGRSRIVALEGGFHGRTLGALSATGQPAKWEGFGPLVPGVSFARPNDVESLEAALAPAGDTALLLLEPVLGEGGVIPLEPAFAQAAAELALEVGALLCVDEVQAGMGRTGTFFAYEQLGILPDIVTLAKGLGNGLPIGALLAGTRAAPGFVPGDHGSTFGGNPMAAAIAREALKVLIDEKMIENSATLGAYFLEKLRGLKSKWIKEVRGKGLWIGLELVPEANGARRFCEALRFKQLLCKETHIHTIRFAPPLNVTKEELDWAFERIEAVFRELA